MREVYEKVIKDAFEDGVTDAWAFWNMTPGEVNGRLMAHNANLNRAFENLDTLAWMTGSYVAIGHHKPADYPDKPNMVRKLETEDEEQEPEVMKAILGAFAETHNAIEGVTP